MQDYPLVESKVMSILAKHSRFRLNRGRKVWCKRPVTCTACTIWEAYSKAIHDWYVTNSSCCILQVFEIRPTIKWNKGNALEYLLDTLGFADSSDVLPIYIGDDRTDEDAFKVFLTFFCVVNIEMIILVTCNNVSCVWIHVTFVGHTEKRARISDPSVFKTEGDKGFVLSAWPLWSTDFPVKVRKMETKLFIS